MVKIAFFIPDLEGGGAEKSVQILVNDLSGKGYSIDLILVQAKGIYLDEIHSSVHIVSLNKKSTWAALGPLASYLRQNRPGVLVSHLRHCNIIAMLAKRYAAVNTKTIVVEHNTLVGWKEGWKEYLIGRLAKYLYPKADARVAVSRNSAIHWEEWLGMERGKVVPVYNPVVHEGLFENARIPLSHPWYQRSGLPVFLSVGRLEPQKDFHTLIRAFALVSKVVPSRLLILGEGRQRQALQEEIDRLGLTDKVSMPGFEKNPFAYMSKSAAFVLSSVYEGLSNVLVEAMACGCKLVSTNCPEGPSEILQEGKLGRLVKVGDPEEMSRSMLEILSEPADSQAMALRALDFTVSKSASGYLSVIQQVLGREPGTFNSETNAI